MYERKCINISKWSNATNGWDEMIHSSGLLLCYSWDTHWGRGPLSVWYSSFKLNDSLLLVSNNDSNHS